VSCSKKKDDRTLLLLEALLDAVDHGLMVLGEIVRGRSVNASRIIVDSDAQTSLNSWKPSTRRFKAYSA
jgi:hypothetical protein